MNLGILSIFFLIEIPVYFASCSNTCVILSKDGANHMNGRATILNGKTVKRKTISYGMSYYISQYNTVGIAQAVQQRATGLMAWVQFPGISSFSFVLFSYVLLTSLCINVMHSVFCTTYVLLFTYCSFFM
jgi:hypothetical protein